ncbi:MAG TPA: DUF354 domain-containing protein [Candidatus Bathyarchaeia archaeon]|nr:DUF354 domain-containing protein [Candidatus Bathyarchaeia archaeon]
MRVWIDSLTPKHALFFEPLSRNLRRQGHDLLITTRKYREAEQTLRLRKLPFSIVGEHGGGTRYGKLLASGSRIVRLAGLVEEWHPDTSVSFSSPEAARVAFGLGVPHVSANDSPHSWQVARLSIPLSRYVCSPWIIPRQVWLAFGAWNDGVFRYKALDAAAWIKRHKPDPAILRQLGLDLDRPIIVLRTEESFATYLEGKASDQRPVILPIIDRILRLKLDIQLVVSTRYGEQAPTLKRRFGGKIQVLDRIVDTTSLLSYSTMFIGSGGTMTVEAALLGKPAISCFPGTRTLYMEYLEKKRLMKTIHSPSRIAREVSQIIGSPDEALEQGQRGKRLVRWMEDPIATVERALKKTVAAA